ncbi:MAG: prolipoprotein diacylglyceryl transferase [Verrucomicrobia bacterium]|nr:prolipoprotein diacylglyceryl transferase [Verrucomicrobiota bacterium]
MNPSLGKVLYGSVFCLGVPALLALWTARLDAKLAGLPVVRSAPIGGAIAAAGVALMLRAMWDLWRRGGGLPMNAFPPPRLVATGAYRLVPHPIYAGFGLVVAGVMLAIGSAAGLWIVVPVTALAMVALVVGYERIALDRRFGPSATGAWLARPPANAEVPAWSQRLGTGVLAYAPWLLAYEACVLLFRHPAGPVFDTMLPFERAWPVWEWTAVIYLGAYLWCGLAPFVADSQAALRRFAGTALWGTGLIGWCLLALPCIATPRPVDPAGVLGRLLALDREFDSIACAFPSFHVFWAFAAADLWRARLGAMASRSIALAVAASCITTGTHSLLDVLAGWLAYVSVSQRWAVWAFLRNNAERIANSWRDWRVGHVRIINHGGYVAAAMALGLCLIGTLLGPSFTPAIITVALIGLAGAGLWGQWLEASSQLSRPFGYFGGLFGACVGSLAVQFVWGEGWFLAGAFSVAAPVIQATGRLRCLVQGCCHGRPVAAGDAWLGIRHTQPLSRVCKLAKLDGVPIHPTPLYSILGNFLLFGLLVRLWLVGADLALITGVYFMLSTCARFMEEGYRGEPQTVQWGGLHIYQWLAIGCLLAGIAVSTLPAPTPPPWSGVGLAPLAYALPIGAVVWFCMGVDFPASQRRMSRLA